MTLKQRLERHLDRLRTEHKRLDGELGFHRMVASKREDELMANETEQADALQAIESIVPF